MIGDCIFVTTLCGFSALHFKISRGHLGFLRKSLFCSFSAVCWWEHPPPPPGTLFIQFRIFFFYFSFHLLSFLNVILLIWLAILKCKWAVCSFFFKFLSPTTLVTSVTCNLPQEEALFEAVTDIAHGVQLTCLHHWSHHYSLLSCRDWSQNPWWCNTYTPPPHTQQKANQTKLHGRKLSGCTDFLCFYCNPVDFICADNEWQ